MNYIDARIVCSFDGWERIKLLFGARLWTHCRIEILPDGTSRPGVADARVAWRDPFRDRPSPIDLAESTDEEAA